MLFFITFLSNIYSISCTETTTSLYEISQYSVSELSESNCENILPGLSFIQKGVDITKLDLLQNSFDGRDGFNDNIIEFTCRKNHRISLAGKQFQIPDQFNSVKQSDFNPDQVNSVKMNLFENYAKLKDYFAKSVGITYTKGWFSESQSSIYYQKMFLNSSSHLFLMDFDVPLYSISLSTRGSVRKFLSDFLNDYIDNELNSSYEEDPERYFDFFKTYGTHFFKSATLGGSLKYFCEAEKSLPENETTENFSIKLRSTFLKDLQTIRTNITSNNSNSVANNSCKTYVKITGGDQEMFQKNGFSSWHEKLIKRPQIIKGRLEVITSLIRDENKRNNLKKALNIYIGMSYLEESKRALNSYLIILPLKVKESIQFLMQKIDHLQQQDVPNLIELRKIMNQLK